METGFQISQKKSVQSVKSAVEKDFWHIFEIPIQEQNSVNYLMKSHGSIRKKSV